MSTPVCLTCTHWRSCSHNPHTGHCENPVFKYTGHGDPVPVAGLGYWDSEGYSAGFRTHEAFGCIHWTNKENQYPPARSNIQPSNEDEPTEAPLEECFPLTITLSLEQANELLNLLDGLWNTEWFECGEAETNPTIEGFRDRITKATQEKEEACRTTCSEIGRNRKRSGPSQSILSRWRMRREKL